jgi:uncharacterized protein YyaL (SSP411 family)
MQDNRTPNRLAREQSPYLLQHAYNPVDWYPWCDEAFERARAENKPVFVSIGYATCHWCHVMERESFEDDALAEYLNNNFISIKVDREERPDVDAMCMDVCQTLTGHGGWPLTIIMDPEKRPFFAGTYFPRYSVGNRLGFMDVLSRLKEVWVLDHQKVVETASMIVQALRDQASASFYGEVPLNIFEIVADHHKRTFDDEYGGFGSRPKFPSPHHILLLLRIAHRTGDKGLLSMVCSTLDAWRSGGMYDHVGFGMHRYSTDREWKVPHFEKMLYDQAMAMMAYTEAWQMTRDNVYETVVMEIAQFLMREMTSEEGAFYSAQDADSEGEEGKYYVWTHDELHGMSDALKTLLNVRIDGNFHDEASGHPMPSNILHVRPTNLRELLNNEQWRMLRPQLLQQRLTRVRPLTDDKVLADWNGLMIGALAKAARAFDDEILLDMAVAAYGAFAQPLACHRMRNGDMAIDPMLDDVASMGWAAFELYQTTGASSYLFDARQSADRILDEFADDQGALYCVNQHVTDIPVRQKSGFDSAYPSGNSMAAMLFAGLGALCNDQRYRDAARTCVQTYGAQLQQFGPGYCMLLSAWDMITSDPMEIAFNGDASVHAMSELMREYTSAYNPSAVIAHRPEDDLGREMLSGASYPFDTAPQNSVLVCRGYACELPRVAGQNPA